MSKFNQNPPTVTKTHVHEGRYLLLLLSLVLMLVIAPLLQRLSFGFILKQVFLMAVFVTGVLANRHRRHVFFTALVIAAIAIPLVWAAAFFDSVPLSLTTYVVEIAFFGMTAAMILLSVMKDYDASRDAIFGAICVYLLMGLTWAMIYSAIEFVEVKPFEIAHQDIAATVHGVHSLTSYTQMVYFSFVTMSTLGYGDMTPVTPVARTMTWMQSVAGQLYIAVLIARLVSAVPHARPLTHQSERECSGTD